MLLRSGKRLNINNDKNISKNIPKDISKRKVNKSISDDDIINKLDKLTILNYDDISKNNLIKSSHYIDINVNNKFIQIPAHRMKLFKRENPSDHYSNILEPISNMLNIIDNSYQYNTYYKCIYIYEIAIYLYKMLLYNDTNINLVAHKYKQIILNKLGECIVTERYDQNIKYIADNYIISIYRSLLALDYSNDIDLIN